MAKGFRPCSRSMETLHSMGQTYVYGFLLTQAKTIRSRNGIWCVSPHTI